MVNTEEIDINSLALSKNIKWDKIDNKFRKHLEIFYNNIIKGLKIEKNNKERKKSNRIYKINIFERELIKLIKKMIDNEELVQRNKKLLLKRQYKDITKRIDIIIGNQNNRNNKPVFFLELKYCLELNSLGAALLEGIMIDKKASDKFFVVSLFDKRGKKNTDNDYYNRICATKLVKEYIDGYVCFSPEYDPELKSVNNLLKKITKTY